MNKIARSGILFVLSAPSGAGKTTLTTALRQKPDFVYAVSCTTRAPRSGEVDGEDYFFIGQEDFLARISAGDFLEYAEVHGRFYGTLKSTVLDNLSKGVDVLIDIDTAGAANIRSCGDPVIADALADVFIMPPGLDELARRLRKRGTESEEQIAIRIRNAASEMQHWRDYRYTLISGSMEEDIEKFRAVMRAERYLSRRLSIPGL
ncbi:MAG: guanylate kinase [Terrimicrobiaceae bacterium]